MLLYSLVLLFILITLSSTKIIPVNRAQSSIILSKRSADNTMKVSSSQHNRYGQWNNPLESVNEFENSQKNKLNSHSQHSSSSMLSSSPLSSSNSRGLRAYHIHGEIVDHMKSYDHSGYPKLTAQNPSFDDNIKRNVTIPQGGTAFLQCKINHLGDRTVSWVRQKDLHILTSGRETYTSDSRFRSINLANSNEWTLEIRDTRLSDSGIYECQISTDPKMSTSVYLSVIALKTVIVQGSDMYLKKGANINLTCLINYTPESSSHSFVIWQHGDEIMNYDSHGRGVKLTNSEIISPVTGNKSLSSTLLISRAQSSDSGNYTCRLTSSSLPSHYARPALIRVHVLNGGENPAAMQGSSKSIHLVQFSWSILFSSHWWPIFVPILLSLLVK